MPGRASDHVHIRDPAMLRSRTSAETVRGIGAKSVGVCTETYLSSKPVGGLSFPR